MMAGLMLESSSILDFGCGTGRLLELIHLQGRVPVRYTGVDLSQHAVNLARSGDLEGRFVHGSLDEVASLGPFDHVFVSGTFNNALPNNWHWMTSTLRALFRLTAQSLTFNNLSRYVEFLDPRLYYADPAEVFTFCKSELSPLVRIEHDYFVRDGVIPFEFTTRVIRTGIGIVGRIRDGSVDADWPCHR